MAYEGLKPLDEISLKGYETYAGEISKKEFNFVSLYLVAWGSCSIAKRAEIAKYIRQKRNGILSGLLNVIGDYDIYTPINNPESLLRNINLSLLSYQKVRHALLKKRDGKGPEYARTACKSAIALRVFLSGSEDFLEWDKLGDEIALYEEEIKIQLETIPPSKLSDEIKGLINTEEIRRKFRGCETITATAYKKVSHDLCLYKYKQREKLTIQLGKTVLNAVKMIICDQPLNEVGQKTLFDRTGEIDRVVKYHDLYDIGIEIRINGDVFLINTKTAAEIVIDFVSSGKAFSEESAGEIEKEIKRASLVKSIA